MIRKTATISVWVTALLLVLLSAFSGVWAQESNNRPPTEARLQGAVQQSDEAPTILNTGEKPPLENGTVTGPPRFADPSLPLAGGLGAEFQSSPDAPAITVWYGLAQKFGHKGLPQKWVNILGNVSPAKPATLTYSLNGGPAVSLKTGPDTLRLDRAGDFNIELDYADLIPGPNQVVITATDGGEPTTATITVNYQANTQTWTPGTYTYDWTSAARIDDLAQVVDGHWQIADGEVKPVVLGFDRLIGLGDLSWRDYTVTVPIKFGGIYKPGYQIFGAGVGVLMRWGGHYDDNDGVRPVHGWRRLGTLAWYRWDNAGGVEKEGLQLIGHTGNSIAENGLVLQPDTEYFFKVDVQSSNNPGTPATYRLKVWEVSGIEPNSWNLEQIGIPGEPTGGGFLLLAHNVEAEFGKVTVDLKNVRPNPKPVASDDFSDCLLNSQRWTFINPLADATLTTNGNRVDIGIPSGNLHDFWTTNRDAPRLSQVMRDEDFELDVKFESAMDANYQMQGVFLEGDPKNFLRYGFEHDGAGYRIAAYTVNNNVGTTRYNQTLGGLSSPPMYLRIKRVGNLWLLAYSADGTTWTPAVEFYWIQSVSTTGVFAGNAGLNPAMTGSVDYFFNTRKPIIPEDGNRKLEVTKAGSGTGNIVVTPQKSNYDCGDTVTLEAIPDEGSTFVSWGGDLSGSTNPTTVVMNSAKQVVATFALDGVYVVDVQIDGNGTVTKSPDKPAYSPGEQVTLTAVSGSGYTFTGWSGDKTGTTNPLTLIVNDDLSITATFSDVVYNLQVTTNGLGSVVSNPPGFQFPIGTQVQLTAMPAGGYRFAGWTGSLQSTTNPITIMMDSDKAVTAVFVTIEQKLFLPSIIR